MAQVDLEAKLMVAEMGLVGRKHLGGLLFYQLVALPL